MEQDYNSTTEGVRVSVRSFYLDDQSRPEDQHYVWAYRVKIENLGASPTGAAAPRPSRAKAWSVSSLR